jgi:hypothetical protein
MDEESTVRRVIPPGIKSSGTKNPPKVWDSARKTSRKILQTGTISASAAPNPISLELKNLIQPFF